MATTTAVTAMASAGANTRHYVTSCQVVNGSGTATNVVIRDGAGLVYWRVFAATTGGGVAASFPVPIRIAANQTVEIENITTGATTYVNLQGFTAGE